VDKDSIWGAIVTTAQRYLAMLDRSHKTGYEMRLRAFIVNYADDLVICCRDGADKAAAVMRILMEKLKLTVNEAKTRVCHAPDEKFDFLGYTFGRCHSPETGRSYIGTVPSK
jgi:hypothetical protein